MLLTLALAGMPALAETAEEPPALSIPYQKYELNNGLDVILAEDHSVPFVQVNIWYNVGSKDEVPGRTGFAHLFEHLMFQGSEHLDDDYFVPLQKIGAQVNGTTNFDRTNYFEGVPSEYLPLALWLESDRMGYLLPALTPEKLENQKLVVRNERRQSYENRPYGEVWMWLYENLFPEDHPYHTPTIGKHEDLEAATMDDVKAFFEQWYVPNNASLVICGDFEPAEAKALVARYFSELPAVGDPQPLTTSPTPTAPLTGDKVVRKTDDVPHDKVWIAWVTPALYAPGDAELDILSSILTDGKDSRLYKPLVRDRQIAKDVTAFQSSSRLVSFYAVEATAADGHTTDELVAAIDEILAGLRKDGVTDDELAIAKVNWESRFYGSLQSISSKANLLNSYNVMTGDPGWIGKDLQRYLDVDSARLDEALNTWLPAEGRVVLHVSPEGKGK